jgi:uncharacterized membrane protein YraQ (UPF0718 family)
MSSCCNPPEPPKTETNTTSCCESNQQKWSIDWLLWGSLLIVALSYALHLLLSQFPWVWLHHFTAASFELINTMFWGILIGILMIGIIGKIPRELVISALGTDRGIKGITRATCAGVLLDLCSHGILMVGAKLYERV